MKPSPPTQPSNKVARRFGKYVLVQKIAEGGMAEIFLAKQLGVEGFEKNVVIKRMHEALSSSTEFVQMFLDEARLASTLIHPNIVQIIDLGLTQGYYFICMEYLAGDDLAAVLRAARLRDVKLPTHVVLRVIAEAARGLHYAHDYTDASGRKLNVVHRDVSPSNIFITYSGAVKLLDFGIAKAESTVTQTTAGVVKGKYQYMSPEQALGEKADRRTDVYALGVTAYEALTLHRPFARDTDLGILKAVLEGDRPPLGDMRSDLPDEVIRAVDRAMKLDVNARYQTAADFADDLEQYVASVTSASTSAMLSSFLSEFFDEHHVKVRSRIPSLTEMQIVVPPEEPTALTGLPALEEKTKAGAPISVVNTVMEDRPAPPGPSRTPFFLALGVAAAAVVVALAAVLLVLLRPQAGGPSLPDGSPGVEAGLGGAGAVITPPPLTFDAGPADSPGDDAGAGSAGTTRPPKAKVVLTAPLVRKVLANNTGRIQGCFMKHRALLPATNGRVTLTLTIAGSGKVTAAEVDEAPGELAGCLESSAKAIHFPAHVDAQVIVPLPVSYDIR